MRKQPDILPLLLEAMELWEHGLSGENILQYHPDQVSQLRPYFFVVSLLEKLAPYPTEAKRAAAKKQFLAAAQTTR